MVELELIGLHGDGEHLTLAGPDGQRYQLLLDDALRAAVRRDRPQLEQIRAGEGLRPREIQSRIRAGATAQDVADAAGLPLAHVQRYEGPVLAERAWVVDQARRFTVGRAEDSPPLGDLVLDRLATRGVRGAEMEWDAVRPDTSGWQLVCRFSAGEKARTARWEVDMTARATHALDDEARWLSETDVAPAGPVARRHLAAVRLYDVDADGDLGPALAAVDADLSATTDEDPFAAEAEPGFGDLPAATTDDLLAELRANRGTRPELEDVDDDDWGLPPAAHPPASRSHEAFDAQVLPLPRNAQSALPGAPEPDGTGRPGIDHASDGTQDAGAEPAADPAPAAGTEPVAAPTRAARSTRAAGTRPTSAPSQEVPERTPAPAGRSSAQSGASARPGASAPPPATPDRVRAPATEPTASRRGADAQPPKRRASRNRRASVPSWDEIVFGARPD